MEVKALEAEVERLRRRHEHNTAIAYCIVALAEAGEYDRTIAVLARRMTK